MTMTSSTTSSLRDQLDLVEIKPGVQFSKAVLQDLLPDVETTLFFGKVYELDAQQLGDLLHTVHRSTLTSALFAEGACHSNDLQDYLVGHTEHDPACFIHEEDWHCSCGGTWVPGIAGQVGDGDVTFDPDVPHGEILPQMWEQLEVVVADSIKVVASKLESVVSLLPGKQGSMVFSSMLKLNKQRPTIGDYRANIQHARQKKNLVILDVSGSMTSSTIHAIIEDVVALSYSADADMAVVSDTTTYWTAGSYGVDDVLRACQFSGTHYETLAPLFDRDWGTVITVADYDSSRSAKEHLARVCVGRIDEVLDISLVGQPTYLAECVGQLADSVRPILIGSSGYNVLR